MAATWDGMIRSRGGLLGDKVTSVVEATRLATSAFNTVRPSGVVLHFHGGLVDAASGLAIAERLAPIYSRAGGYPLFSVWESGLVESIRNNLKDVLKDKVFQELLKKAAEWVARESGGAITTRGAGQNVDVGRLRGEFDLYLGGTVAQPPLREDTPGALTTKGIDPDENELATKIESELELDDLFQSTLAGLAVAAGRIPEATTRGAAIEPRPVDVLVDDHALDEMFPHGAAGVSTRGGIVWLKVARFVARVVIAVIRRFHGKRDHGGYTTVVEEVLRAAYLSKVGEVVWRMMKKDTGDAFNDATGAGEVVLKAWATAATGRAALPRVILIGHSTGAVYINHWLDRSAALLPALRYDLVLLAPACRSDDFAATLERRSAQLRSCRIFGMKDAIEQQDRLVSIIYPRSLLYFVSGVLEGDADVPLLGMQRYVNEGTVFDGEGFPGIAKVRSYLNEDARRAVWSIDDREAGLSSAAVSHGDFDDDEATLASLAAIIERGF